VDWTFGTFLWAMVVFFFWFTVIWMFISIFADILRRDMSGWAKVGWILLIVVLPFLGMLIYLVARPRMKDRPILANERPVQNGLSERSPADDIATAARLHDEGKITAEEFERLKQHALSH
jgi:Phospholipase_D-nuclease N-terminal